MGSDRSDDEIDSLLAEGRFAAPTRDRVFEGALRDAGIGQAAPASRRRRLWFASGVSLAAAAAAFVMVPRLVQHDDGFRAKGGAGGAELDVACAGTGSTASLAACPLGSTLVFS